MSYSVVVLSKDAAKLRQCFFSICAHEPTFHPTKFILVNDGIPCEDLPLLIWPVVGRKPFIFARNANIGMHAAGADDVILLNDDALLESPGGFSLLETTAATFPDLGIIAATTNSVGNLNQLPAHHGLREDPRMVCFVCVYIPRRTIDLVGYLDERYVDYGMEDDDYCFRIRQAGLKIGIHDGCFVDHERLHSSFRGEPGTGGDFRPNMRRFIDKWGCDNWGTPKEKALEKWGLQCQG